MDKIPNNSDNFRERKKEQEDDVRVKRKVQGAVQRKHSSLRELTDGFIQEEPATVRANLWDNVLIPAAKKTIFDMLTTGLEMFFYGAGGKPSKSKADKASWRDGWLEDKAKAADRSKSNRRYDTGDVIFQTYGDATTVQEILIEIFDQYQKVRVADFFSAANLSYEYTDNNYGWTDIRCLTEVKPQPVSGGGYVLKLPRPVPLD